MIREVNIFHSNGISIIHLNLGVTDREVDKNLFAGVSSAVSTFLKELGHGVLHSINVEDGIIVYSSSHGLFFAVHASGPEGEVIGPFFVKQIEFEFIKTFKDIIDRLTWDVIETSIFQEFKATIQRINENLLKLYESNRNLFNFFPTNVPMAQFYELLEEGTDLIDGFPEDTIRLVRQLDKKYDGTTRQEVFHSLGQYFGHDVSKKKLKNKIGVSPSDVLKLLNEISVAKFDARKEQFILSICPVCRGKRDCEPVCDFFTGFIQGCFDNPKLQVSETACKAKGDKNCTFQIKR
ncbi:MAG: V4R domain-containing protein [Candidatus Odinarchaeota archaeon]